MAVCKKSRCEALSYPYLGASGSGSGTDLHEALRGRRAVAAARHGERHARRSQQRGAAHAQRRVQRARAAAA